MVTAFRKEESGVSMDIPIFWMLDFVERTYNLSRVSFMDVAKVLVLIGLAYVVGNVLVGLSEVCNMILALCHTFDPCVERRQSCACPLVQNPPTRSSESYNLIGWVSRILGPSG